MHTTTSRPHCSNFTGFQFIPEFTSRSASSCIQHILQHFTTLYVLYGLTLLLHLAQAESAICLQRRLHLRSILSEVWKIELSQPLVPWLGTAFQNRSAIQQLLDNSRQDWKLIFFHLTMTSHLLLISTRHRDRFIFYIVRATKYYFCLFIHSNIHSDIAYRDNYLYYKYNMNRKAKVNWR